MSDTRDCVCGCGQQDEASNFFTCSECKKDGFHFSHMYYCTACEKHSCEDCMSDEHNHDASQEDTLTEAKE